MPNSEVRLNSSKLILGTAQFGLNYGITNTTQIQLNDIQKVLKYAEKEGITSIDTSSNYGNSERVIGENNTGNYSISTKFLCPKSLRDFNEKEFFDKVNLSLELTKVKIFDTLFVHNADEFINDKKNLFYSNLLKLKNNKKIKKIGASVYDPNEVFKLLDIYDLDVIQIPLNLFDQRFIEKEVFNFIENKKIEVHIRSVFLQGILLSDTSTLPKYFSAWKENFKNYEYFLKLNKTKSIAACLNFVYDKFSNSKIIIGFNSFDNFVQIISNLKKRELINPTALKTDDLGLIDPRMWK